MTKCKYFVLIKCTSLHSALRIHTYCESKKKKDSRQYYKVQDDYINATTLTLFLSWPVCAMCINVFSTIAAFSGLATFTLATEILINKQLHTQGNNYKMSPKS